MKKITLLFSFLLISVAFTNAQIVVTVSDADITNGYVNAFNESDMSYAFGFGYPTSVMKTTFPTSSTVVLQPNFGIWDENDDTPTDGGPAWDPAWFDAANDPNKIIEGISYAENNSTLVGQDVTFVGTVDATTIDAGYVVRAFIKVLDGGYGLIHFKNVSLSAAGDFTVNATAAETGSGAIIQYGFDVTGLIAAPSAEASLGSVNISARTLDTNSFEVDNFNVSPNPSNNVWNIKGQQIIENIQVFDVLGKQVMTVKPNNTDVELNANTLPKGLYFAKMSTEYGSNTIKLIKN